MATMNMTSNFIKLEANEVGIPGVGYYKTGKKKDVIIVFKDNNHIVPKWLQVLHNGKVCQILKFEQTFDNIECVRYTAGKYEFQHQPKKADEVFYYA